MLRKLVVLSAVIFALAVAGTATAAPASSGAYNSGNYTVVFNHGNNPGDTCSNTLYFTDGVNYYFVGYYVGVETFVANANGSLLQCHLTLQDGVGVADTLVLKFDGLKQVYTPSGNATFNQHA
jgi:hypothetical protein